MRTVASAWFNLTPRASLRWASKPNWEVTNLSSYDEDISAVLRQDISIEERRVYLFWHEMHDRFVNETPYLKTSYDGDPATIKCLL